MVLSPWIEKNLVDAEFCKHHAKEVEIRTQRVIYNKTYDSHKAEFENDDTYGNWWDIRGNPFTISCIEPKYFNEMESEDNNVIPGETYSDVPPRVVHIAPILIFDTWKGKENAKIARYTAKDTEVTD